MGGWNPTAGLGTGTDPNAPLSSLLPKAPASYKPTVTPGVDSSSKLQYQADIMGLAAPEAIGAGTSLLGTSLDYWQKLLQPPTRQSLLERQGPAVSSVVGQYSTGKQALERLPRGGGTSATLANLPFQEAGDITGLIEGELSRYQNVLQPAAAQAVTGISELLSNLGLAEMGLSSKDLSSLIAGQLQKDEQNSKKLAGLGKGLGILAAGMITAATGGAAGPVIAGGIAGTRG